MVDTASAYNKQISCGEDVISRIIYAKTKRGLDRLQRLVVETINDLLTELQARNGIELYEIHEIAVAGNTTMTHLLLGLDPKYLREEPYIPTIASAPKTRGRRARAQRQHARPRAHHAVGGQLRGRRHHRRRHLVGPVHHRQAHAVHRHRHQRRDGAGHRDWLLSCACSAGPAFEGGGVRHGMRASAGAIEDVYVDDATWEPTLPHGRRRPARRHLRQRAHRPARRALRHRPARQVRALRPGGAHGPHPRGPRRARVRGVPRRRAAAPTTTSCSPSRTSPA